MAYNRVNWKDLPSTQTPLTAENLNRMDEGIWNIENSETLSNRILANSGIVFRRGQQNGLLQTPPHNNFFIIYAWDTGNRSSGSYYFEITGQWALLSQNPLKSETYLHSHHCWYTPVNNSIYGGQTKEFTDYYIVKNSVGGIYISYNNNTGLANDNITYRAMLFD